MLPQLTSPERRLKTFLKAGLFLTVLFTFFHLVPACTPVFLSRGAAECYQFLSNGSLLLAFLICLVLVLSTGDLRRYSPLVRVMLLFLGFSIAWTAAGWIRDKTHVVPGDTYAATLGIRLSLFLSLFFLSRRAARSRYGLKYLTVQQFQTLQALAEVCISGDSDKAKLQVTPLQVAANVDGYLLSFRARSKWVMKLVLTAIELYPMLSLHVPLSQMLPEDRLNFLRRRFLTNVEFRAMPDWYRQLVQAAIRMSKQLCYMGYYSDPGVYDSIGYTRFRERADVAQRLKDFPDNHSQAEKLKVMTEEDLPEKVIDADVVIVGSGAAASVLANQLIKLGRQVLLVEKGSHEQPSTFTDQEVDMVSRLYADGALQLSRDFRFQVFQGSCVGGSTVVNNAACFSTPDYILDRWIGEMGIAIDRQRYLAAMDSVYKMMRVAHTPAMTLDKYLNPGGTRFSDACKSLGYKVPELDSIMANIDGCLGCGYCNIGCQFGRKLSMLDTVLPQTQLDNPGALRILADCEVLSFNRSGSSSTVSSVSARFKSGRKIIIRGKTFVCSAGAISSSLLLINSKLGIAMAGKKLAFNLGSQMTAAYNEPVNSFDGLQISHYLRTDDRRYVMETWFNPPMFQSTAMPGWFDQHFQNMREYNHMACTGVLVGTASNAEVRAKGIFRRDIRYKPTEEDFDSLMDALTKASEIYLSTGARRIMPNTFNYYEYLNVNDLKDRFRKDVKSSRDISTGTGHPQGGNVMAKDAAGGVVDAGFKVFGFDNLFVCDASVFPTSLGVNPQITVMTLAYYAAPLIAANGK